MKKIIDLESEETRRLIQGWIKEEKTGNLNDKDTVFSLIQSLPGFKKFILDQGIEIKTDKPLSSKPTIAICIGHSYSGDKCGELSCEKISEWDFNSNVGKRLESLLVADGYKVLYIDDYKYSDKEKAGKYLMDYIFSEKVALAIELKFSTKNQFESSSEYCYHHRSINGKSLANSFSSSHTKNTGKKSNSTPISDGDDFLFLDMVLAPSIVCKPFCGKNKKAWDFFKGNKQLLAKTYFDGIEDFFLTY